MLIMLLTGATYLIFHSMSPNLYIFTFGLKQQIRNPTYVVNSKPIKQSQQQKDLGVTFSSDFNWTTHYKTIATKAYQNLGLIRFTFNTSNTEAKIKLYITIVWSQSTYCSQLCRPQLIKDINSKSKCNAEQPSIIY